MKNKLNKSKVKRLFSAIEVADQVMAVFDGVDYLFYVMPLALGGNPNRCVVTFTFGDEDYVVTEQALSDAVIKNNMVTLVCEGGRVITIKLFRTVQVEIK